MRMKNNKKGQGEVVVGLGVIFVAIFVVGLIILAMGFDTIEPSHMGVMVAFGNIKGVFKTPTGYSGMQWTGIFTDVVPYDMRIRRIEIGLDGDNYAPSREGQKVFATIEVNYRVKKSEQTIIDLYQNVGTDDIIAARLNIPETITEGFKQTTSQYDALEILEKRQEVKEKAVENIRKNFPAEYFEIDSIVITNIHFSEQFANEIEAKQTAIQAALKEQNNLEVIKFQQQQEIERYKAEAEKIKLQSQQLTDLTIKQAWISKWDGKLPAYMIATPQSANFLMQLPTGATGGVSDATG